MHCGGAWRARALPPWKYGPKTQAAVLCAPPQRERRSPPARSPCVSPRSLALCPSPAAAPSKMVTTVSRQSSIGAPSTMSLLAMRACTRASLRPAPTFGGPGAGLPVLCSTLAVARAVACARAHGLMHGRAGAALAPARARRQHAPLFCFEHSLPSNDQSKRSPGSPYNTSCYTLVWVVMMIVVPSSAVQVPCRPDRPQQPRKARQVTCVALTAASQKQGGEKRGSQCSTCLPTLDNSNMRCRRSCNDSVRMWRLAALPAQQPSA